MFVEERHKKIIELLTKENRVLSKELAQIYDVSIDTIRRDLKILEEQGLLNRTHGGAILNKFNKVTIKPRAAENRFEEIGTEEENLIAEAASQLINKNDVIFLGGSSIIFHITKYLPTDFHYVVMTNSLEIAQAIKKFNNIDTFITPGKIKKSCNITDSIALDFINGFKFDISFVSGGGFTSEFGLSTSSIDVAKFYKAVITNSTKTICVLHQEKIGRNLFAKIVENSEINLVITDKNISKKKLDMLNKEETNLFLYGEL